MHEFKLIADLLNKIQHGQIIDVTCGPGTITECNIIFTSPMHKLPKIFISILSGSSNADYGKLTVFAFQITTSSFILRIANAADVTLMPSIMWLAISL